jgi:hypothetical protein
MNGHVHEELALLLRGEADHQTVNDVAAHLRGCEDCRQELISALVAHASLTSAAVLAQGRSSRRVAAEAGAAPDAPLPDLSAVFAQVRAEASESASESAPTSHPHRAWRGRWVAAAAVLGLAVGGGAVAASTQLGGQPSTRTVRLAAFGAGTVPATAKVLGRDEMTLNAASLPSPGAGKLYEVWLTNSARTRMYAVGSLGANRTGTFTVAADLIGTYSAIEVSVQPLNDSAYSGVSVLRGAYT